MRAAWRSIRPAPPTRKLSAEEQFATGVTEGYVRLSVGLEHIDDIPGRPRPKRWRRRVTPWGAPIAKPGWAAVRLPLCRRPRGLGRSGPRAPEVDHRLPDRRGGAGGAQGQAGVTFADQDGWTIATDDAANAVLVVPAERDPAYPAVVRRQSRPTERARVVVQMDVLCSAPKTACDDLVRAFERMNDEARRQLQAAK